ncbi:DNA-binding transcriptional MerR regulator [Rhizomicrobium palustre]|uniref:DNA-binding transcriptional MerR regulator n=1 Tax=Rhizomicrobium palustre TaxID=189966 RepID=A0A846N4J8_9PROT|nr:MerR family transcriptional regulator [Rhizomicrobium palustre]NIK89970.1 DNA-binding transcriptional MerR regulator [Rhizomicrobium palustre]
MNKLMTTPSDIHLSPAEAARKLGVSAKALRLYERHGLVKPIRAENGWRAYGPAEMARLHQVLALKGLGLPLARIGTLLQGQFASLDAILELQESVLARDVGRLGHALELVRAARAKLATGQDLSVDDLSNLTTETTMTAKPTAEELNALFDPISAKHFSPEELAEIKQRKFDQNAATQRWDALIAEAKALMKIGDPASPAALDLARRWRALVLEFTGGDSAVQGKLTSVWKEAFATPDVAPKLPFGPELMGFVMQAQAKLKELEA